ncbi:hypothetical protein [Micromonospora sp. 4G55]|uniref:hypothetical protein n=1 Tax=Micromonospora sp. 4G55 TaxID=2806102 RepID=UPI001A3996DF|nr:hypothetical protein [Micromonospora sp. 4G55]MBM0259365.1 hypothetical protein [Micromonospora sp. 4G55]
MTDTNPASVDLNVSEHPTTDPEAKPTTRKRTTKAKATPAAKPEFAPKVNDKGRLDHSDCGHERTLAGRSACRAAYAKANAK